MTDSLPHNETDLIAPARANTHLINQVLTLAQPFGRFKLALVFFVVLVQGLFQVAGVTSVFPFLALAADPGQIHDSACIDFLNSVLPDLTDNQLLTAFGMFAITMMVLSNLSNILSEFVRARYAHQYGHWLRIRLLNQILAQPYGYYLENNSAVLLKKVYTDVLVYVQRVLLCGLEALARIVTASLLIVTLLFVHPGIALTAAFVFGGFYLAIYLGLRNKRDRVSNEFKESWGQCAVELQQMFTGIKPIKVHEVESKFVDRFSAPSLKIATNSSWLVFVTNVPRYVIEPVAFGGIIVAVVVLFVRGVDLAAVLPAMGVMAFAGYRLLPTIQVLYGQLTTISSGRYALEEVYDEFVNGAARHTSGDVRDIRPLQWKQRIEFDNVTFSYKSAESPVFRSLSLKLKKNTSTAFVGKTGAGKSTFIDLLTALHEPDSGQILVDDTPITPMNRAEFRAAIGYVPQEVFLTDDSVASNIALGIDRGQIDHARLRKAAQASQILDFIETDLTDGFQTVVGERGVRLSGGQKQRIGLARALYRKPSILILDEATSALDNETEADVMRAVNSMRECMTIIVVAHRLETVKHCDEIYQLGDGTASLTAFEHLAA